MAFEMEPAPACRYRADVSAAITVPGCLYWELFSVVKGIWSFHGCWYWTNPSEGWSGGGVTGWWVLSSSLSVSLHVLGIEHRCATALTTFCCLARSDVGTGFLQLLWEKPIWEGVLPCLDPWDSVCLRTASVEWNVPGKYGPHGELFFFLIQKEPATMPGKRDLSAPSSMLTSVPPLLC